MTSPVIVGYDPVACDHGPVEFGVAAARFTRAPLMIASVHGVRADRVAARQMGEELLADAAETLAELEGELHAQGVEAQLHDVEGMSAPRALHELAEAQDAGLLVIGSTRGRARKRTSTRSRASTGCWPREPPATRSRSSTGM